MAKLFIILGLVATALVITLRIAGVISDDIASDVIARTLGIVAVLGLTAGAIGMVAGKSQNTPPPDKPNSGPKF